MEILDALQIIGEKAPIYKHATMRAATSEENIAKFTDVFLQQYSETKSQGLRMREIFSDEVIDCLIEYAKTVNAWADIKLAEIMSKETNTFFSN